MPAANKPKTAADFTVDLAASVASEIIGRARKATGPMWDRMSPDYRLTECRAFLCCDMLWTMDPADHALMVAVHRALITTILPE